VTRLGLALIVLAAPRAAEACATCVASGYGDRSFSWPYFGLMLVPFLVGVVIAAVLAWYAGWRRRDLVDSLSAWLRRQRHRPPAPLSPRTHTETT
jgi:hypothetical protein